MGFSVRVFFVDGNQVARIPLRRYEELRSRGGEAMPEWASHRVHCAMAYVEMCRRKPQSVLRIDYTVLTFDSRGRLDYSNWQRQGTLAAKIIEKNLPGVTEAVVELGPYLAVRQLFQELSWKPTDEQARTIYDLALR